MIHVEANGAIILIDDQDDTRTMTISPDTEIAVRDQIISNFFGPSPIPHKVSMMQTRIALRRTGKLAMVEAAVAAAGGEVSDYWEYTTDVHRDHPIVVQLAAAIGMTDAEVDDLFRQASSIV